MIIKEGKYYKDRSGHIHGPISKRRSPSYPWCVKSDDGHLLESWSINGFLWASEKLNSCDLVEEYIEPPPPEKEPTPIDLVTPQQYKDGVAKVFDSYRLRY